MFVPAEMASAKPQFPRTLPTPCESLGRYELATPAAANGPRTPAQLVPVVPSSLRQMNTRSRRRTRIHETVRVLYRVAWIFMQYGCHGKCADHVAGGSESHAGSPTLKLK